MRAFVICVIIYRSALSVCLAHIRYFVERLIYFVTLVFPDIIIFAPIIYAIASLALLRCYIFPDWLFSMFAILICCLDDAFFHSMPDHLLPCLTITTDCRFSSPSSFSFSPLIRPPPVCRSGCLSA